LFVNICHDTEIATDFNPEAEDLVMSESYVIIGDGIAGSSAAETIREEAPEAGEAQQQEGVDRRGRDGPV